ncbi:MAG: elongation factor Ts [Rickettsiales bacterium]|nr:elongation factor Ts [Rickettsiales bacterium]|tara:strand:+ start:131 stop:781 length:651 start_codon:yes stop_codon:yes gene_type:complete
MSISASMVKDLRTKTGAGILDCKKALTETAGDFDKAVDWLRTKGMAIAAKKAGRAATEGTVHSYIHAGGKLGVLVEINCETDFVARGDDFQLFVQDVAMHIAASGPRWVRREEAPEDEIAREKGIFKQQAMDSGKPEEIAEKMVTGKLNKFFKENCLMEQAFVKDEDKTIEQLQTEFVARCGENIQIRRFTRWVLGEGLEKKADDFVDEVRRMAEA